MTLSGTSSLVLKSGTNTEISRGAGRTERDDPRAKPEVILSAKLALWNLLDLGL